MSSLRPLVFSSEQCKSVFFLFGFPILTSSLVGQDALVNLQDSVAQLSAISLASRVAARKVMDCLAEFYFYVEDTLKIHGDEGLARRITWDDGTDVGLLDHINSWFKEHEGFIAGYSTSSAALWNARHKKKNDEDEDKDSDKDEIEDEGTQSGTTARFSVFFSLFIRFTSIQPPASTS